MDDIPDLTSPELAALAEVVKAWEELIYTLSKVGLKPRNYALHIETDAEEKYLGWVGCGEHGSYSFQPASEATR